MSFPQYSRQEPFLSTLLSRYCLTKQGSTKRIDHLELSLKGSGICYKPGDSLGVYPLNHLVEVESILTSLQATGEEEVVLRSSKTTTFFDFLLRHANLQTCNKALFQLCLNYMKPDSPLFKQRHLLEEGQSKELKAFLGLYHVSDFLSHHPVFLLPPQELATHLLPMLPRFYSIASSMHSVGDVAHLTVGLTEYLVQGIPRQGVASRYLCHEAPLHEEAISIYLQATKEFTLPQEKERAMIMIGAGTGIAPYRGFLQERLALEAQGPHWLFFGERHRHTDFLYEEYWNQMTTQGNLRLSLAFSRDQSEKRYVQHLLVEQGKELYRWLEEGAYLYVCGDATNMAKEVESALLEIFIRHGGCTPAESQARLQALRKEKRYLRDVY